MKQSTISFGDRVMIFTIIFCFMFMFGTCVYDCDKATNNRIEKFNLNIHYKYE